MIRSTPWVDGCCGPMLMIIVWLSPSSSGQGPPVMTSSCSLAQLLRALVGLALERIQRHRSRSWPCGPGRSAPAPLALGTIRVHRSLIAGPGPP